MSKFVGLVGYTAPSQEVAPGVWSEVGITERKLKGDVIRQSKDQDLSTKVNDDITLQNRISLVADKYAYQNYQNIQYVVMDGGKWKVTAIEVARPRLILSLGGVWNG